MFNELQEMEEMHGGFGQESNVMKIDDEDHEPMNLSDSIGKYGEQLPLPEPAKKPQKEEESPAPNQFVLDDLMDEFGESKGKELGGELEVAMKQPEKEKEKDFLDEFDW